MCSFTSEVCAPRYPRTACDPRSGSERRSDTLHIRCSSLHNVALVRAGWMLRVGGQTRPSGTRSATGCEFTGSSTREESVSHSSSHSCQHESSSQSVARFRLSRWQAARARKRLEHPAQPTSNPAVPQSVRRSGLGIEQAPSALIVERCRAGEPSLPSRQHSRDLRDRSDACCALLRHCLSSLARVGSANWRVQRGLH